MKERLVGAAVLVAIAVWLIPWVLDGPEEGVESSASSLQLPAADEPMPMRTEILRLGDPPESRAEATQPKAPAPTPAAAVAATPPHDEEEPEAEENEGTETTVADTSAAAEPAAPSPEPRTAATAPKPKAEAQAATAAAGDWAVQLGSFSDEANARRVAQRAGTFGYKADVSSFRSNGRTLYRVRVGPQATRAAADAAASALRAHGVDAQVVAAR